MKINKWDNEKKEYAEHDVPDDWNIKTYTDDMDEVVNCVCCGKKMMFGDGYTSRRFHNVWGFGYCECAKCYFSYEE